MIAQFILWSWYPAGLLAAWWFKPAPIKTYSDLGAVLFVALWGYLLAVVALLLLSVSAPFWNKRLPWVK